MKKFCFALLISFTFLNLNAGDDVLRSGPMLGYSEMREVMIWLQTNEQATVMIDYNEKNSDKLYKTKTVKTNADNAFIAKLIADKVMPGKEYEYRVFIDQDEVEFDYPLEFQTQKDWLWKSDPPEIKFATGSGTFINDKKFDRAGEPYGGGYKIYEAIHKNDPDFMLWLGDNVYFREADWNTRTGIYYRYAQVRELPEMQPLLASTHHYAIWDDHDYGPNNSNRSYWFKDVSRQAFIDYWGNLTYGKDGEGIFTKFTWGDADFFLLDDRWFRTPEHRKTGERELLGHMQMQWLTDNLIYSQATFKFVVLGGQVLNPVAAYETYSTFPEEKNELLDKIRKENIDGVVFISGDRHYSELTKLPRQKAYSLYDFTVSPLNSSAYKKGCQEKNYLRVNGTCFSERNYGLITISGKRKNRKLTLRIKDVNGELIWKRVISENELKNK